MTSVSGRGSRRSQHAFPGAARPQRVYHPRALAPCWPPAFPAETFPSAEIAGAAPRTPGRLTVAGEQVLGATRPRQHPSEQVLGHLDADVSLPGHSPLAAASRPGLKAAGFGAQLWRPRLSARPAPSGGSRDSPYLRLLVAAGDSWLVAASPQPVLSPSHGRLACVSPFLCREVTGRWFRAQPHPVTVS